MAAIVFPEAPARKSSPEGRLRPKPARLSPRAPGCGSSNGPCASPPVRKRALPARAEEHGGHEGDPDLAAPDQADADGRRLRDAVHERAYHDRCRRTALLLVAGALAVPAASPAHLSVGEKEGYGAQQQPEQGRIEPAGPVGFIHQLEGHGRDQDAGTESHDAGDHAPRGATVYPDERPDQEGNTPDKAPERRDQRLHETPLRAGSSAARDALVDRAVLADSLPELLRGLLGALFREPTGAGDDIGADAPGLPVVVGDVGVHHREAALGLLVALRGIGDEVALLEDLHDGSVGQLDGPARVVHEDSLDLAPPLLVAPPALLGERLDPPLDLPSALPKLPLRLLLGAPFLRGPLVLAPELLPAPLPLLLAPLRAPPPQEVEDR